MHSVELISAAPETTRALGRRLGQACIGGEVLLLHGMLGAGKTCFLQGVARGLGIPEDEPVVSPTFVLHVQYHGRLEFNHLDAYRLADAPDVGALGLDELYADTGAVTAIEWAGLLRGCIPEEHLLVDIEPLDDGSRRLRVSAMGTGLASCRHLVEALACDGVAS